MTSAILANWDRSTGPPEEEGLIVAEPDGEEPQTSTVESLSAERRRKRDQLVEKGIDPYPIRFDRTSTTAELREKHGDLEADVRTGQTVRVAGRLTSIRGHGKLSFANLEDVTGKIQLLVQQANLDDRSTTVLANFDLGDWIGAEGEVITSRRGELSVDVTGLSLLSKALLPLPDKWHGLTETDIRYRQREEICWPTRPAAVSSTSASRPLLLCAACWWPKTSSRWTHPSSSLRPAGRWPVPS